MADKLFSMSVDDITTRINHLLSDKGDTIAKLYDEYIGYAGDFETYEAVSAYCDVVKWLIAHDSGFLDGTKVKESLSSIMVAHQTVQV